MAVAMPVREGLSAEEAALRLAPLVHLLDGLSRRGAGWLEHAAPLEHKVVLADHLADDARAAAALSERVAALDGRLPGAPSGATAAILDNLDDCGEVGEHLDLAYGLVKPLLAEAADSLLDVADPLLELPTVTLLLLIRADQRRHVADLPPRLQLTPPALELLSAVPGRARTPAVLPVADPPARDAFLVQVAERPPLDDLADALHALLHALIAAGERAARSYHQTGNETDARRAAVQLRHASIADRLLGESGTRWGQRPVGPPHSDPYAVAEVIAVQHPVTARTLGHVLSERV